MKYVISVLLVLSVTSCKVPSDVRSKTLTNSQAQNLSVVGFVSNCSVLNDLKKNGSSYESNDNTRYWCTDHSNAARHLRMRVFKDGSFARHEIGLSEELFSQYSDPQGDVCYMNLQDSGVTKFDFYNIVLDGSKYLIQFDEWDIGLSGTSWDCGFETDSPLS